MPKRHIPLVEGYAQLEGDARMFAPAAARNLEPIAALLAEVAPTSGKALEIASGTGQHATAFAERLPDLHWQPTEIDEARRASIDARAAEAGLGNLAPAIPLDATTPGWGAKHSGQGLIFLANLLHLISEAEAKTLITEAASALAPGGVFVIYGPFMRAGELTSDGDRTFHARLVEQDPDVGYKDDFDTMDLLQSAGLEMVQVVEMPANNLALVARRP